MTSNVKALVAPQDLANSSATLYTSPATGKGTWIDKAIAVNHSGAARQVTFNVASAAAGTSNLVVDLKSIADKATDLLPELVGLYLAPGENLYGFADTATSVSIRINGRELT